MKLFPELTKKEILHDLFHYYEKEQLIFENENELRLFFKDHVEKNAEEIEIQEIFNISNTILVDTPDGFQKIGEKIKKNKRECFSIITVGNKKISCSHDHKIQTPTGWKFTKELSTNDFILTRNGYEKILKKYRIKDQEVYDFEVLSDNHRYWGGDGISSHNTGRTYMSLLTALHILKTEPQYKKIVLIKSLQIIKGEDLGYLPGSVTEKMEPYMYSFTGNLDKIFGTPSITNALMNQGVIEVFPIAYIRGVTIDNAIVIIDEAQNIDMHTFRTIITRIGKSCKMVFLGDTEQIDRKQSESCLARVSELFTNVEYAESVVFTNEESVRNPIIPNLLELLKNED